jgi:hypothetical protein
VQQDAGIGACFAGCGAVRKTMGLVHPPVRCDTPLASGSTCREGLKQCSRQCCTWMNPVSWHFRGRYGRMGRGARVMGSTQLFGSFGGERVALTRINEFTWAHAVWRHGFIRDPWCLGIPQMHTVFSLGLFHDVGFAFPSAQIVPKRWVSVKSLARRWLHISAEILVPLRPGKRFYIITR